MTRLRQIVGGPRIKRFIEKVYSFSMSELNISHSKLRCDTFVHSIIICMKKYENILLLVVITSQFNNLHQLFNITSI